MGEVRPEREVHEGKEVETSSVQDWHDAKRGQVNKTRCIFIDRKVSESCSGLWTIHYMMFACDDEKAEAMASLIGVSHLLHWLCRVGCGLVWRHSFGELSRRAQMEEILNGARRGRMASQ